MSWMCVSRFAPARWCRSPSPVSVGVKTSKPARRSSRAKGANVQPPRQPPGTKTIVFIKPPDAELLAVLIVSLVAGCASPQPSAETTGGLVGARIVTASRPAGVGKNLLTFSSDGTFFRSGDTHPVLSGAHGTWKRAVDGETLSDQ